MVIDQPEDNLDNRFIYDGIVPRVRDLKGKRQLIISTHNANIPVLGDAELVLRLDSQSDSGGVADQGAGSIDEPAIRAMAEDLLEGGKDAFEDRRRLYAF